MLVCPAAACGGPTVPSETDPSRGDAASESSGHASSTGSIGATSRADETTPGDTGVLDTGPASTDETGPLPKACGNGIVEPGERCDDPLADPPTCSADCQYPSVSCDGPHLHDCGNTIDDDGDGLVDLDDPDCLSPCDDHEHELSPGGPVGSGVPSDVECYWDVNGGQGDDGCDWDLTCDPESPGAPWWPYDPSPNCASLEPQSAECIDSCVPLTPNGCDCFGCCVIDGQNVYLGIDEGNGSPDPALPCAAATLEGCNRCTIHESCFNPCDSAACELCFLQAPEQLAPGCDAPACPAGVLACTSSYECPDQTVCKTGCCLGYEVAFPS